MTSCKVTEPSTFQILHHNHTTTRYHSHPPLIKTKMKTIIGEDILSPLPNCNSCGSPRIRQRSFTLDSTFHRPRQNSLPKDPVQPKQGSISDIHIQVTDQNSLGDDDDEEGDDDIFIDLPPMRSRSRTCPDSVINRRKLKVKSQRRPSTPPPDDLCTEFKNMTIPRDIGKQFEILVKFNET